MANKIKVKHGPFVENPKCKFCKTEISHEWLNGDYSLLVCDNKKCLDKLSKK